MLKLLGRLLVGVILLALLLEGVSGAFFLINQPSDLAILVGVVLLLVSLIVPVYFGTLMLRNSKRQDV